MSRIPLSIRAQHWWQLSRLRRHVPLLQVLGVALGVLLTSTIIYAVPSAPPEEPKSTQPAFYEGGYRLNAEYLNKHPRLKRQLEAESKKALQGIDGVR